MTLREFLISLYGERLMMKKIRFIKKEGDKNESRKSINFRADKERGNFVS